MTVLLYSIVLDDPPAPMVLEDRPVSPVPSDKRHREEEVVSERVPEQKKPKLSDSYGFVLLSDYGYG